MRPWIFIWLLEKGDVSLASAVGTLCLNLVWVSQVATSLLGRWELSDIFVLSYHLKSCIRNYCHRCSSSSIMIYYYVGSSYTTWPYIIIYHHHISSNLYQIIIFSFNMLLNFSHQLRSNEDPPVPGAEDLPTEITPSRWGPVSNGNSLVKNSKGNHADQTESIHYDTLWPSCILPFLCLVCVFVFFLRCNYKGWPHDHSHSFLRCGVLAETQNLFGGPSQGESWGKPSWLGFIAGVS